MAHLYIEIHYRGKLIDIVFWTKGVSCKFTLITGVGWILIYSEARWNMKPVVINFNHEKSNLEIISTRNLLHQPLEHSPTSVCISRFLTRLWNWLAVVDSKGFIYRGRAIFKLEFCVYCRRKSIHVILNEFIGTLSQVMRRWNKWLKDPVEWPESNMQLSASYMLTSINWGIIDLVARFTLPSSLPKC